MKKLVLLCATVASGLLAMNASATLPKGFETVNFHAVLTLQDTTNKTTTVSLSNKDLLNLIGQEYNTNLTGAQLVSRGLDDEEGLAVLSSKGTNIIEDASFHGGDDYRMEIDGFEDTIVKNEAGTSPNFTLTGDTSEFFYNSGNDEFNFFIEGTLTVKDNEENSDESYSMPVADGSFELNVGGEEFGTMTGGVSGSGTDVQYPYWED